MPDWLLRTLQLVSIGLTLALGWWLIRDGETGPREDA